MVLQFKQLRGEEGRAELSCANCGIDCSLPFFFFQFFISEILGSGFQILLMLPLVYIRCPVNAIASMMKVC